jgi:uncharacterized protein (TIGR00299 family) protein
MFALQVQAMRALYFDAFSGVSGDMTVGALLALGVPLDKLEDALGLLPLDGFRISVEPREVNGIQASKFDVLLDDGAPADQPGAHHHHHHHHGHRSFRDIRIMIDGCRLAAPVRERAISIFAVLAEAEGKVHGKSAEEVTFHEVGAIDSIVDIVATAFGIEELGVDRVYVSALPVGSGTVRSHHGVIPVPAPATAEILKGFAVRIGDGAGEMVTPTGAAIVAALARPGESLPPLRVAAVGYGAGTRALEDRPNLLRLLLGEVGEMPTADEMVVLETNIDDSSPEIYEHVMQQLFDAGARDVWLTPVQMKKNRPATLLRALGEPHLRDTLAAIIARETSAIGVRFHTVQRAVMPRREIEVETEYGAVAVKLATAPDGTINAAPEYESCRKRAQESGAALKVVYRAALAAAHGVVRG